MDASDTIRKNKARALYVNQNAAFIKNNPNGDCKNLSSCCYTLSSCIMNFPSYENKYDYFTGMGVCNSTSCGVILPPGRSAH